MNIDTPRAEVQQRVAEWLSAYVANLFGLARDQVDGAATFQQYGLDSAAAAELSADLGSWLGCQLDPTIAYEHPSIGALAAALAADPGVQASLENKREHP